MNKIQVSVICNAYNHEKYIRDALEGFVMQKTSFPFEILIHDDASTDHTADIIREYEAKFPDIIKPIYETENQYSKPGDSLTRIQNDRVKGKYIALCEGDDYWTDPYKLQKQFDALESHPEINICTTAALKERDGQIVGSVSPRKKDAVIPVEDVIAGDGGFVATATIMYRTTVRTTEASLLNTIHLDYTIQIAGSLNSGMLFLKDNTAVYRLYTENSWSRKMENDKQAFQKSSQKVIDMLLKLDKDTCYRYHGAVENRIAMYKYRFIPKSERYRVILSKEYRAIFKYTSLKTKIAYLASAFTPGLLKLFRKGKQ